VLQAIAGPDGHDTSVWPEARFDPHPIDWKTLRIGYLKTAFDPPKLFEPEKPKPNETAEDSKKREQRTTEARPGWERRAYDRQYDLATLDKLKSMGVNLIPIELPKLPYDAMVPLLEAEAAAAFDDLTMSGRDKLLTEQSADDWPNIFRRARFYPAVEYIQANRARTLVVQQISALFETVDIIVTPTFGEQLVATNLSGHPALIVPNGLRGNDAPRPPKLDTGDEDNIGGPGTPVSITFLAGLYQEAKLAAFGRAYQQATGFHNLHPKLD
jgi:Asp-tRNA(Asn)/Glu-tRNA(Gln) amidotransferase A subunit family amidase